MDLQPGWLSLIMRKSLRSVVSCNIISYMNSSSSDSSDNAGHHSDNPHNVFDNPELFIEKFDGSDRDVWQKPDEVIKRLGSNLIL